MGFQRHNLLISALYFLQLLLLVNANALLPPDGLSHQPWVPKSNSTAGKYVATISPTAIADIRYNKNSTGIISTVTADGDEDEEDNNNNTLLTNNASSALHTNPFTSLPQSSDPYRYAPNQSKATTQEQSDATTSGPREWRLTVKSEEHLVITSVILGLFALCCIIGNCFVIAAVILERSLHNVANYLILSLAVADLMVAVLVMPLSVVAEISEVWFLHQEVCDLWICVDVLCCTASILHLVAIAMDRYWAVTSIDYIRRRSARRILLMITVVWIVALFISIPPLFGWRDPNNDPDITGQCIISQDKGYTIFSTVGAFYLPMAVMMVIYTRIYQVARSRIRKDKFHKDRANNRTEETTLVTKTKSGDYSVVSDCNGCNADSGQQQKKKKRGPFKSYGCSPRPERKKNRNKKGAAENSSAPSITLNSPTCEPSNGLASTSSNDNSVTGENGDGNTMKMEPIRIEPDPFTNGCNDEVNIAMLQCNNGKKKSAGNGSAPPYFSRTREKLELRRERKAARTLAIITGAFLFCWLPFFIIALIGPFVESKKEQRIPEFARSFVLWLGYVNSLLNPIIYTIFSPEFRSAFQKILFGKYRRGHR